MFKKKHLVFLLALAIMVTPYYSYSQKPVNDLAPDSKSYILIDANSNKVISEKSPDIKLYPASVSKIMTAIVAIENGDFSKTYTASKKAVTNIGVGGTNGGITSQEKIYLEDLLHMLMMLSANDAANVISENIGGTSNFVKLMNKKAQQIGALNTNFTNPIGLDVGDGHPYNMTTARDLAIITRYATSNTKFREIVSKNQFQLKSTNKRSSRIIKSTNRFYKDIAYDTSLFKINGVKTGYTNGAKNTGVFSARNKEGNEIICVVLKNEKRTSMLQEVLNLLDYGFKQKSVELENGLYDIRYSWSEDQVNTFFKKGYIKGYADGSFRPKNKATKEEFISLLMNIQGIAPQNNQPYWSKTYIDEAINLGLVDYSWHEKRTQSITRLECALVFSKCLKNTQDISHGDLSLEEIYSQLTDFSTIDQSIREDIAKVYKRGIIKGYQRSLFLDKITTREETISMIHNFIKSNS